MPQSAQPRPLHVACRRRRRWYPAATRRHSGRQDDGGGGRSAVQPTDKMPTAPPSTSARPSTAIASFDIFPSSFPSGVTDSFHSSIFALSQRRRYKLRPFAFDAQRLRCMQICYSATVLNNVVVSSLHRNLWVHFYVCRNKLINFLQSSFLKAVLSSGV